MRDFGRPIMLVAAVLLLAALPAAAADPEPGGEDLWTGKTRDEIVALFGPPGKVKKRGVDGETLTYKVYRVDPATATASGLRLIPVPGVGVVGIKPQDTPGDMYAAGRTPLDRASGPEQPGGHEDATSDETVTRSYDAKSGKWSTTGGEQGKPAPEGKLKLRFVLDGEGRVKEWSAGSK